MSILDKESDLWKTPQWLLERLDWNFDPCPSNPTFDGLVVPWHGKVMCNPPYSQIPQWIAKAISEAGNCESIVLILPVWASRQWFHQLIENYPCFVLEQKVSFEGLYQKLGKATFRTILFKIK